MAIRPSLRSLTLCASSAPARARCFSSLIGATHGTQICCIAPKRPGRALDDKTTRLEMVAGHVRRQRGGTGQSTPATASPRPSRTTAPGPSRATLRLTPSQGVDQNAFLWQSTARLIMVARGRDRRFPPLPPRLRILTVSPQEPCLMSQSFLPDILVIGGAHIDRIARSTARLEPGQSNPGSLKKSIGGVAGNIANALSRLEWHVALSTITETTATRCCCVRSSRPRISTCRC